MEQLRITRVERDALQRQLQAEKRANRHAHFATSSEKILADEDDDEEIIPSQPLLPRSSKPTQTSTRTATPASKFTQPSSAPTQTPKSPSLLVKLKTPRPIAERLDHKSTPTRRPTTTPPFVRRRTRVICQESSDEHPSDAAHTGPPTIRKRKTIVHDDSSDDEPARTPPNKRIRKLASSEQLSDDELGDYDPNKLGLRTPASKKARRALKASDGVHIEFTMVARYSSLKVIQSYESKDMRHELVELWERIAKVQDIWELKAGTAWGYEFEKPGCKQINPEKHAEWPCITSKLIGVKSRWRQGCEGRYACRNCAEANRPCFVWTGEMIWLLPLDTEDRVRPVEDKREIRYWIADDSKPTMGTEDDDEDYMEVVKD